MITLPQLSEIDTGSSKQINICRCAKRDDSEIIMLQTLKSFSEIPDFLGNNLDQYEVFKIETKNDVLAVYVVKHDQETDLTRFKKFFQRMVIEYTIEEEGYANREKTALYGTEPLDCGQCLFRHYFLKGWQF